jgi:hypothetical protein
MIVAKIHGGLGNQMFQYAAGRALSIAHHETLSLDTNEFANYSLHQGYVLDRVFGLNTPRLSGTELRQLFGLRVLPTAQRLAARWPYWPLADKRIIIEPHLDYWPGMLAVPPHAYLRGYWQSERYFQMHEDSIRSDFQFNKALHGYALQWSEHMKAVPSVSVHFRRGDYVSNQTNLAYHGTCSLDYYQRAVASIEAQVKRPEFFVFSDDIEWARQNFKLAHPVHFVDGNTGDASFLDMQLMSLCRHHIIANSSFSWWAAWLNNRKDKLVMAPSRWYVKWTTPVGLIPDRWTAIQ